MCTIKKCTNSFEAICNWIRELSISIKEFTNTANTPAIWENVGITELSNSITELSNWVRELFNSFKDQLNSRVPCSNSIGALLLFSRRGFVDMTQWHPNVHNMERQIDILN